MSDCIPCGCRDSFPTKELSIEEWKDEYLKLVIYTSAVSSENKELRESLEFANSEWEKESLEFLNMRDENAKLLDENARLRSCLSDDADNARQIMGENAKLRELLQRTWDAFHDATAREFVTVKNELRELGVEVDG